MIRYLSLAEYFWLAEQVTGVEAAVLTKASRVDLADSALHAPSAGFGEEDFYPDLMGLGVVSVGVGYGDELEGGDVLEVPRVHGVER